MVTIMTDYPDVLVFWKEVMAPAFHIRVTSFNDKNRLTALKWTELIWRECGNERYYGEKAAFYYKLSSRAAAIYYKIIKREDVTSQIVRNFKEFLKTETTWREGDIQNTKRDITDINEPILSLTDMSRGSYGAFSNRPDWLKNRKTTKEDLRSNKGIIKGVNKDGQIIIGENWKRQEERTSVGKLLTALATWEIDLHEELQQVKQGLFYTMYFPEGKVYRDLSTGRILLKSWEQIEEEENPEIAEARKAITVFSYDKKLPYPENLKNRETVLQEELKITRNKDLIQKRISAGQSLIEAWEQPMELKTREEFDKIKDEVIGFEEFIEEVGKYLDVARKKRKSGQQVLPSQRFYLLLGPPGIGKTHIAQMIAEYLGKQYIKINCATAFDTELIGREQTYQNADFGNILKKMIDGKDSAPVIAFDEIDKCRDPNVLDIISVLFDDTTNKHDFEDSYFQFPIPMNRVFFIATANDKKKLAKIADFVLSRCTEVKLNPLTYEQRIKLARKEITKNLKIFELEQYIPRITTELLNKCLVKEIGIRQTNINTRKIADQIDSLDTKYGGEQENNAGKINIPNNIDFAKYNWSGLIVSDGIDPNCPVKQGKDHAEEHKCFIPTDIPGWVDNMGS